MVLGSRKTSSGIALIEMLVACSIIVITTFALVSAGQKGVQLSELALSQGQANTLLEEGAEATKTIRDAAWTNISGLTIGTTYYLSFNTSTNVWSLSTTPTVIDSLFTRTVVLAAVNRDSTTEDIVTSGGVLDGHTKNVTVTVSWPSSNGTVSKSLSLYIADIFS